MVQAFIIDAVRTAGAKRNGALAQWHPEDMAGAMLDALVVMIDLDEGVRRNATLEGISSVKLLQEGWRISAANASQICDGASAVLTVSDRAHRKHNGDRP